MQSLEFPIHIDCTFLNIHRNTRTPKATHINQGWHKGCISHVCLGISCSSARCSILFEEINERTFVDSDTSSMRASNRPYSKPRENLYHDGKCCKIHRTASSQLEYRWSAGLIRVADWMMEKWSTQYSINETLRIFMPQRHISKT